MKNVARKVPLRTETTPSPLIRTLSIFQALTCVGGLLANKGGPLNMGGAIGLAAGDGPFNILRPDP